MLCEVFSQFKLGLFNVLKFQMLLSINEQTQVDNLFIKYIYFEEMCSDILHMIDHFTSASSPRNSAVWEANRDHSPNCSIFYL